MFTGGILKYLGEALSEELMSFSRFSFAEELRIRRDSPVMFYAEGREYVLDTVTDASRVRDILLSLSLHSLTAFSEDIRNGFFTIEGGIRVGVAGRAVCEDENIKMLRDYTSLNIRFPRQLTGIHSPIFPFLSREGEVLSTLIISAPQHGKTTLLRDILRAVSSGELYRPKKVCAIDERGELSGNGGFDLGIRTDVLMCPKAVGMRMALRSLSPDVIVTDEIGGDRELEALFEAGNCGIRVVASAHAGSLEELMRRRFFSRLIDSGFIDRIVLLTEGLGRSTAENIFTRDGTPLLSRPLLLRQEDTLCSTRRF